MGTISEPNPPPSVSILDLVKTSFTLCFRLPWTVGATLLRRWWPWTTYKPPPLREHIFRHVMTCLGNHVPLSVWQWYTASDMSGLNLKTSKRYGHIPHLFESVRTPEFSGFWICRGLSEEPIQPRDADLVLLHAHGGGYVAGHPSVGAPEHVFLAEILQNHGLTTAILSLNYTLAPKAVFPKQRDEAVAAYDCLCGEMGVDPSKIIVIGDSAGGHFIMSLLVRLYERQHQTLEDRNRIQDIRPAAAVLISPWLNLYTNNPRALELHWEERLHKRSLDTYCEIMLRNTSPDESQIYGNFALGHEIHGSWADILPAKTLVTAGDEELVFLYDVEDFVHQAEKDGCDVVLQVAEGKNHTWQCAEAFAKQGVLLGLGRDEDIPGDLMAGYQDLAMTLLKLISS